MAGISAHEIKQLNEKWQALDVANWRSLSVWNWLELLFYRLFFPSALHKALREQDEAAILEQLDSVNRFQRWFFTCLHEYSAEFAHRSDDTVPDKNAKPTVQPLVKEAEGLTASQLSTPVDSTVSGPDNSQHEYSEVSMPTSVEGAPDKTRVELEDTTAPEQPEDQAERSSLSKDELETESSDGEVDLYKTESTPSASPRVPGLAEELVDDAGLLQPAENDANATQGGAPNERKFEDANAKNISDYLQKYMRLDSDNAKAVIESLEALPRVNQLIQSKKMQWLKELEASNRGMDTNELRLRFFQVIFIGPNPEQAIDRIQRLMQARDLKTGSVADEGQGAWKAILKHVSFSFERDQGAIEAMLHEINDGTFEKIVEPQQVQVALDDYKINCYPLKGQVQLFMDLFFVGEDEATIRAQLDATAFDAQYGEYKRVSSAGYTHLLGLLKAHFPELYTDLIAFKRHILDPSACASVLEGYLVYPPLSEPSVRAASLRHGVTEDRSLFTHENVSAVLSHPDVPKLNEVLHTMSLHNKKNSGLGSWLGQERFAKLMKLPAHRLGALHSNLFSFFTGEKQRSNMRAAIDEHYAQASAQGDLLLFPDDGPVLSRENALLSKLVPGMRFWSGPLHLVDEDIDAKAEVSHKSPSSVKPGS